MFAYLYVFLLDAPASDIQGQAFNVSIENASVMKLAEMIRDQIDPALPIQVVPTDDNRSYHLSAKKLNRELGFHPKHALQEAVADLQQAFSDGRIPDVDAAKYRNVVWMKQHPDFWAL